jgi:hypothetical protein
MNHINVNKIEVSRETSAILYSGKKKIKLNIILNKKIQLQIGEKK